MTKVYDSGNWKDITNFYVRNSNSWQEADTVYQKQSGNWKLIYDRGPYGWTGDSIEGFGFAYFSEGAECYATFDNNGTYSQIGGPYSINDNSYAYAPASKVSELEIRYNSAFGSPGGDLTNQWLSLSTSRTWFLSLPSGIVNDAAAGGTILIRRGDALVASGPLNLYVRVYNIG